MSSFTRITVVLLAALALSQTTLLAQFDTGSITGLVKDATNSAVPGAKMTLVDRATGVNVTTTTNEAGIYEFPTVRVGTYTVTSENPGFSQATAHNGLDHRA